MTPCLISKENGIYRPIELLGSIQVDITRTSIQGLEGQTYITCYLKNPIPPAIQELNGTLFHAPIRIIVQPMKQREVIYEAQTNQWVRKLVMTVDTDARVFFKNNSTKYPKPTYHSYS